MPHLFGTDGVRGRAGEYPLDHATVARIGAALVRAMRPDVRPLRLIVGRDTRESGEWIEQELARGAGSVGATVTSAGVVPTPAIAYVTREMAFDAGIVISASHNPFQDNGIKVFSGHGQKFTESLEREVEAIVAADGWTVPASAQARREAGCGGRVSRACPPGVARSAAPGTIQDRGRYSQRRDDDRRSRLFSELRFDVHLLGDNPDGRNINLDCGSTHPQALARRSGTQAREWALPSTATGTARFSPTRPAPWSMAMPCCSSAAGR
jgi:phosphoglucosamine mutase